MSLIQELRRRNVMRVGVLYLVAAWLLLQLTDVLSSLLRVPESTGSLVVVLLVLGFFPVGIFEYWQAREFPPQCKPVGDDDFECGRP